MKVPLITTSGAVRRVWSRIELGGVGEEEEEDAAGGRARGGSGIDMAVKEKSVFSLVVVSGQRCRTYLESEGLRTERGQRAKLARPTSFDLEPVTCSTSHRTTEPLPSSVYQSGTAATSSINPTPPIITHLHRTTRTHPSSLPFLPPTSQ